MGNAIVKRSKRARSMMSAKVMMMDGSLAEFKEPITVAELMMEYPLHLVCHSSAMQAKKLQKKAALPADVQLEVGRLYYLLPASKFQGPLVHQQRCAQKLSSSCNAHAKTSKLPASTQFGHELFITGLEIQQKNGKIEVSRELQDGCNQLVHPLTGLRITRDDICVVPQSAAAETEQDEEEEEEEEEAIVSFSTPDLRSMYMSAGAGAGAQPSLTRTSSWKPRLETIQEVGALSRKRFQNFVRGRTARNQVHDHLNT